MAITGAIAESAIKVVSQLEPEGEITSNKGSNQTNDNATSDSRQKSITHRYTLEEKVIYEDDNKTTDNDRKTTAKHKNKRCGGSCFGRK